jgi:hypothetical protein
VFHGLSFGLCPQDCLRSHIEAMADKELPVLEDLRLDAPLVEYEVASPSRADRYRSRCAALRTSIPSAETSCLNRVFALTGA